MVVVVDTSVWIDVLRHGNGSAIGQELERRSRQDDIVVGDLVLLELLQGARSDAVAKTIERQMRDYIIVEMMDTNMARAAALNYRKLRSRGVTIRTSVDMIIGTYCIENDLPLLQNDRDFQPMAEHLGLQLV